MKFNAIAGAVATCIAFSWAIAPAHAEKTANSLITDFRVKQVAYDPNQVFQVIGIYGYQTSIEFAADEVVKVVTLGDSLAWQTVPYQNRLFIKPVEPNASTNLTVITTKRTYYFNLSSSKSTDATTYLIRFIYPNNSIQMPSAGSAELTASKESDYSYKNMDYWVAGDKKSMGLKQVFDDGEFTFFKFDRNAEIPAFYIVRPDGTEANVNYHREDDYMVIERVGSLFTIRNGDMHLCIQNGANQYRKVSMKLARSTGER